MLTRRPLSNRMNKVNMPIVRPPLKRKNNVKEDNQTLVKLIKTQQTLFEEATTSQNTQLTSSASDAAKKLSQIISPKEVTAAKKKDITGKKKAAIRMINKSLKDVNPKNMFQNWQQAQRINNFLNEKFKNKAKPYQIRLYNGNATPRAKRELKEIELRRALGNKTYDLLQIKKKENYKSLAKGIFNWSVSISTTASGGSLGALALSIPAAKTLGSMTGISMISHIFAKITVSGSSTIVKSTGNAIINSGSRASKESNKEILKQSYIDIANKLLKTLNNNNYTENNSTSLLKKQLELNRLKQLKIDYNQTIKSTEITERNKKFFEEQSKAIIQLEQYLSLNIEKLMSKGTTENECAETLRELTENLKNNPSTNLETKQFLTAFLAIETPLQFYHNLISSADKRKNPYRV